MIWQSISDSIGTRKLPTSPHQLSLRLCVSNFATVPPLRARQLSRHHRCKDVFRPCALSTEDPDLQQSSSSYEPTEADAEPSGEPTGGSIVDRYLGGPLNNFSRPTQILTPEEARLLFWKPLDHSGSQQQCMCVLTHPKAWNPLSTPVKSRDRCPDVRAVSWAGPPRPVQVRA